MSSGKKKGKGSDKTCVKIDPNLCVFCNSNTNEEEMFGQTIQKCNMTVHYFCMLFSSGLSQGGKSEASGIFGFLPEDIMKEVRRGQRLRCFYCKQKGATIGCVVGTCRKVFHLACGKKNGTLHQYYDSYRSFCEDHRPRQTLPVSDRLAFYGTANAVCSICMNVVESRTSNDTLRAPCCRNSWFHRSCIQRHAQAAGLYFFKCPLCNNKEIFQEEMLKFGIYLPDQDAAWEREPNAYNDLLSRYLHCDSAVCKCPHNREYNLDGGKWEIMVCDWCGSKGAHVECQSLEKRGRDLVCDDCNILDQKKNLQTRAKKKGISFTEKKGAAGKSTDKSLEEKFKSQYPGKSGKLYKRSASLSSSSTSAQKVSPGTVLRLSYAETEDDVDIGDLSDVQPSTSGSGLMQKKTGKRKRTNKSGSSKRLKLETVVSPGASSKIKHGKTLNGGSAKSKKNWEIISLKRRCSPNVKRKDDFKSAGSARKSAVLIQLKKANAHRPQRTRSVSSINTPKDESEKKEQMPKKQLFTEEYKKKIKICKLGRRHPFDRECYTKHRRRKTKSNDKERETCVQVSPIKDAGNSKEMSMSTESTPNSDSSILPDLNYSLPNSNSQPSFMSLLSKSYSESELPKLKRKYKKKQKEAGNGQTFITNWLINSINNCSKTNEEGSSINVENNENTGNSNPLLKRHGSTLIFKRKGKIFRIRRKMSDSGNITCEKSTENENTKYKGEKKILEEMLESSSYEVNKITDRLKSESVFLDSVHKSPVSFSPAKCTRNALTEMKKSMSCSGIKITPTRSARKLCRSSSKRLMHSLERFTSEDLLNSTSRCTRCSLSQKFDDALETNRTEADSKGECSPLSSSSSEREGQYQPAEGQDTAGGEEEVNVQNKDQSTDMLQIMELNDHLPVDDENDTSTFIIQSFGGSHGFQQLSISVPNN